MIDVLYHHHDHYFGETNFKLKINFIEGRRKIDVYSADYQQGYTDCLLEIHETTACKLKRKLGDQASQEKKNSEDKKTRFDRIAGKGGAEDEHKLKYFKSRSTSRLTSRLTSRSTSIDP